MTKWGGVNRCRSATGLCLANQPKMREEEKRETCDDGRIPLLSTDGENEVNMCNKSANHLTTLTNPNPKGGGENWA